MKDRYCIEIESKDNIKLFFDKEGNLISLNADRFFIDNPIRRRLRLLNYYGINLVFDVGANVGQYAMNLRSYGYKGRIVSFEPLSSAFIKLKENAAKDRLWDVENIALGEENTEKKINISANSKSSSILEMLPLHLQYSPQSRYIGKEEIKVSKLDSIIQNHLKPTENIYLKIDTQGYEKKVIEGAKNSLEKIIGIQMELSLVPLYKGEASLQDMMTFMNANYYSLVSLEPGWSNYLGQLLQVDAIFFKD